MFQNLYQNKQTNKTNGFSFLAIIKQLQIIELCRRNWQCCKLDDVEVKWGGKTRSWQVRHTMTSSSQKGKPKSHKQWPYCFCILTYIFVLLGERCWLGTFGGKFSANLIELQVHLEMSPRTEPRRTETLLVISKRYNSLLRIQKQKPSKCPPILTPI